MHHHLSANKSRFFFCGVARFGVCHAGLYCIGRQFADRNASDHSNSDCCNANRKPATYLDDCADSRANRQLGPRRRLRPRGRQLRLVSSRRLRSRCLHPYI